MTTKSIKPVSRETSSYTRDRGLRPIVATIHHGLLTLRPKGLRTEETMDLGALYERAVRDRLMLERREKRKARGRK